MKLNTKSKKFSILTLAATFIVAVFAAVGLLASNLTANADRSITLTGSNFFYTSNNAEVDEYCTDSTALTYYTGFVLNDDSDYVTYRKNLAYNWYADTDSDGAAEEGLFSISIGFADLTFNTFTIKLQSQQYTMTEDLVTSNYITFVAGTDDSSAKCVYVITSTEDPLDYDAEEDEGDDPVKTATSRLAFTGYDKITISFTTASVNGVYPLTITDSNGTTSADDTTGYEYQLENVGGNYSKYVSSSSSNSVIPITLSADGIDGSAEMILYSLNGQSFELTGDDGSKTVTDNTSPVLCVDDEFTSVRYGYGLELNYAVIDVLATSPRTTINYYILTETLAADATLDLADPDDVEYTSVSTSDTYAFIDCNDYYGTTSALESGDGYTTKCLVKIYLTITDSTASGGTSDDVYLDWYIDSASGYLQAVNGTNFIKAIKDEDGVSYTYAPVYTDEDTSTTITCDKVTYTSSLADLQSAYQSAVDAAAADQKITAGDSNYFYLPSFEGYISDNLAGYTDLTYSIYYVAGSDTSVSSDTGLDYNELSISLSSDGTYRFVIYASDGESNDMYYWSYEEQDNNTYAWEKVTFTASDLSDMLSDSESVLWEYVPYFEFSVTYEGLVVEDPEAQDICYVDNSYSASSFSITGLNSGYSTSYTLYVFDREAYYNNKKETISYSYILKNVQSLFEDGETRSLYFRQIIAYDDLEETDDYYDDYCDYEWDPDSLSFVPQDENTFYIIRLVVTDTTVLTNKTVKYMVISSSAAAEELNGESRWVKDNLASIILLAVAAAALIGIVLLIVIKPKETGDIDIIDMTEENKKPRKKIKKNNNKEE